MQQDDFEGIFAAMDGLPITVRLLDPPLHEFLPHGEKALRELAAEMGIAAEEVAARAEALRESEPDARPPRLPAGADRAGDLRHAGRGHRPRRRRAQEGGRRRAAGDHGAAGRLGGGDGAVCAQRIAEVVARVEKEEGVELAARSAP